MSDFGLDLHAIAKEFVDVFIIGIKAFVIVVCRYSQFIQCFGDEGIIVAFFGEIVR